MTGAPLRLLLVYQDARLASSRIRVVQLAPHLEAHGARCETIPYPRALAAKRELLRRAARADVVVLQRKLPAPLDVLLWRLVRRPIVLDFDDAIMLRARPVRGSYVSRTRRVRFDWARRFCSGFICGNAYLASFVRDTRKPVLIAPSPVPTDVPQRPAAGRRRPPRIGWIGGGGNLDQLALLQPALARLARTHAFVVSIISDATLPLAGCTVEHVSWTLASQEAELARLDAGVMPLADSPWARGKCAYKLLQYMAAAVPAVGSAVGMNAELIRDGENGLLATTDDQWVAALGGLLDDPVRAARIAAAGRRTVEERFTYDAVARQWLVFLERWRESAAG